MLLYSSCKGQSKMGTKPYLMTLSSKLHYQLNMLFSGTYYLHSKVKEVWQLCPAVKCLRIMWAQALRMSTPLPLLWDFMVSCKSCSLCNSAYKYGIVKHLVLNNCSCFKKGCVQRLLNSWISKKNSGKKFFLKFETES